MKKKSKPIPLDDRLRKQAALQIFLERSLSMCEASGLQLSDLGNWLLYCDGRASAAAEAVQILADKKADRQGKADARKMTPADFWYDQRLRILEDRGVARSFIEDIEAMGAYDPDYNKPVIR